MAKSPQRGYAFKDHARAKPNAPLPGDRMDTELDRIFQALADQHAHISKALTPDGHLQGRLITPENFNPNTFQWWADQVEDQFKVHAENAEQSTKTTQNLAIQAKNTLKDIQALDQKSQELLSQSLSTLELARQQGTGSQEARSRAELALAQSQIKASDAATSASSARIAEDMAYRWASKVDGPVYLPESGDPVDDGYYSAKWWAIWADQTVKNGSYFYLGPHPSDPTEGPNGNPLIPGMWYYNTTDTNSYIWDGDSWDLLSTTGVSTFNGREGTVTSQQSDYSSFFYTKAQEDANRAEVQLEQDAQDTAIAENTTLIGTKLTQDQVDARVPIVGDPLYTQWKGKWTAGTYEKNHEVLDNPYLMIANKQTTDRPAPQPQGEASWVYNGSSPESSITAKTLTVTTEYTLAATAFALRYRVYQFPGTEYSVFVQINDGTIEELISFTASIKGWREFNTEGGLYPAGTKIKMGLRANEPAAIPTTYVIPYNYITPQIDTVPITGEIQHSNSSSFSFRVHKTDDNGADQSTDLSSIGPGDVIRGGGVNWTVSAVTDNGTWIDFTVGPAVQGAPDGVQDFTFETTLSAPIETVIDTDYYSTDIGVTSSFSIDGGFATGTEDAYGIDLELQYAAVSEDWDVKAVSGTSGGVSGEDNYSKTEIDALIEAAKVAMQLPIGTVISTNDATNPGTTYGYGTWAAYGEGRTQVGVGGGWTLGEERGSETHTLTEAELPAHDHAVNPPSTALSINAAGSHTHAAVNFTSSGGGGGNLVDVQTTGGSAHRFGANDGSAGNHVHSGSVNIGQFNSSNAGSGQAHNNVQPSIGTHMWQRTA